MSTETGLRVLVYDIPNKATRVQLDELTGGFDELRFGSIYHGGFNRCSIKFPTTLDHVWQYLAREGARKGRLFDHIEVLDADQLVWEGRVMVPGFPVGVADAGIGAGTGAASGETGGGAATVTVVGAGV